MIRGDTRHLIQQDGIPRESGDDPSMLMLPQEIDTYSPRERG